MRIFKSNNFKWSFLVLLISFATIQLTKGQNNYGFENGLTGWYSPTGTVISTGETILNWTVNPADYQMASLTPNGINRNQAASYLGFSWAELSAYNGIYNSSTDWAVITRQIYLSANQTIAFQWNYVSRDYYPYNDGSIATLVGPSGKQVRLLAVTANAYGDGSTIVTGDYGSTDWQEVSFTASVSGNYILGFAAFNCNDYVVDPTLFIDDAPGGTFAPGEPIVVTSDVTSIGSTSAVSGGNVNSDGGAAVTARGICWNTTGSPTVNDPKTTNGSGIGAFTSSLSGLLPGTTYYVRAYAINAVGTVYGGQKSFTTINPIPADPTSISSSTNSVCSGSPVLLTANGVDGTVYWYSGSCGGLLLGTGNTLSVNPTANISYFARNFNNGLFSLGCASTSITVNEAPSIICPDNIVLNNDADQCGAIVSYASATVTGTSPTVSYSHPSGSFFPVGITEVVITAENDCGSASCSFIVEVLDVSNPVLNFPSTYMVNSDAGECGAAVTFEATATDNCSATVTYSHAPGSFFPVGNTTVTATATDPSGNTSTATSVITVVDEEAPAITFPASYAVSSESGECGAVVAFEATVSDNCSATVTYSHAPGSFFPVGNTTVTATATDPSGNSVSLSSIITVVDDVYPVLSGLNDISVSNDLDQCGAFVSMDVQASDNCNVSGQALNFDGSHQYATGPNNVVPMNGEFSISVWAKNDVFYNSSFREIFAQGRNLYLGYSNTGIIRVGDTWGNTGVQFPTDNQWHHYVVVNEANNAHLYLDGVLVASKGSKIPPSPTNYPHNFLVAGQWQTYENYSGSIDEIQVWGKALNQEEIACYMNMPLVGNETNLVAYYNFEDDPGSSVLTDQVSSANNCYLTNMDPNSDWVSSEQPLNSVNLTNDYNNTCDGSGFYPVGTTQVVWTATDAAGNATTATQTVTVTDNQAPDAVCQTIDAFLDESGSVTVNATEINNASSDNCGIESYTFSAEGTVCATANEGYYLNISAPSGTVFTSVTFASYGTPTGSCGDFELGSCNASNSMSIVSQYLIGQNSATIPASNSIFGDPCWGTYKRLYVEATYSSTGPGAETKTFSCSDIGANEVTLVVTDIHGNSSTCSTIINVIDNILPVIISPADVAVTTDPGVCQTSNVDIGVAEASDNCSIVVSHDAPAIFPLGETVVNWTVTDASGNSATSQQLVTVTDDEAPAMATQDITIQLDADGNASIVASDVDSGSSDACGIESLEVSQTAFDCNHVGANTVMLTATDVNGNSASLEATVTVEDNVAPAMATQDITIQLDADGNASITAADVDGGSTDACGIESLEVSQTAFDCDHVGANVVELTATDVNGNSASMNATVTVEDNVDPEALCQDVYVVLSNGEAFVTPDIVDAGSNDACGIASLELDVTSFDCGDIGDNPVVLTVTDNNGNVSTCNATVTVEGVIPSCSIDVEMENDTYTGGDGFTIFLGYGPQALTATVTAEGGGPFTYNWTGGAGYLSSTTSATPVFTPTEGGVYDLVCEVTNAYGCTTTCEVSICVMDIRAGGNGNNQKVYLCHVPNGNPNKAKTLKVSVNAVPGHLSNHEGDRLGRCDQECGNFKVDYVDADFDSDHDPVLSVYPNPSMSTFNVTLDSHSDELVNMEVYDHLGKRVATFENFYAHDIIEFGHDLAPGLYYIQVRQGDYNQSQKVVKAK